MWIMTRKTWGFCGWITKDIGLFVLLTVHLRTILVNDQLDAQFLFYIFISILYMFRATSCSSSREPIVSMQHLVCVTLCRWPSSMQFEKLPDLHTRRSPTQSDTYQMWYWYNWLSWWWARGCSKHVENWNKQIEKRIVRQVGHLQELKRWRLEETIVMLRFAITTFTEAS
jgi:hypothetical protein